MDVANFAADLSLFVEMWEKLAEMSRETKVGLIFRKIVSIREAKMKKNDFNLSTDGTKI